MAELRICNTYFQDWIFWDLVTPEQSEAFVMLKAYIKFPSYNQTGL